MPSPRVTASPLHGSATSPPPKPVYRESSCQTDVDVASPSRAMASPTRALPRRPKNPLHRHVFRRSVLKSDAAPSTKTSVPEETPPHLNFVGRIAPALAVPKEAGALAESKQ